VQANGLKRCEDIRTELGHPNRESEGDGCIFPKKTYP